MAGRSRARGRATFDEGRVREEAAARRSGAAVAASPARSLAAMTLASAPRAVPAS